MRNYDENIMAKTIVYFARGILGIGLIIILPLAVESFIGPDAPFSDRIFVFLMFISILFMISLISLFLYALAEIIVLLQRISNKNVKISTKPKTTRPASKDSLGDVEGGPLVNY